MKWFIDANGHDETRNAVINHSLHYITYPAKWDEKKWDIGSIIADIFKKSSTTDAYIITEDYTDDPLMVMVKDMLEYMGCSCLVVGEDATEKICEKYVSKGGTISEF